MILKGAVYHNPKFIFRDGHEGNKLLILLNSPNDGEEFLFVKTTSQGEKRSKTPGCGKHPIYNQGEFFIPTGLPVPTWVIVSEIYPIPQQAINNNPNWILMKGVNLPSPLVDAIIDCLLRFKHDDISEIYEAWLKPSIQSRRLKLAEKFNRRN